MTTEAPHIPWASPAARARIDTLERELGPTPLDDPARVRRAIEAHLRQIDEQGIVLYAGTNVPTPAVAAAHVPALATKPSMGDPGDKYQTGLEHLDELEVLAARAVASVMGAAHAEVRIGSASLANLAVYAAVAEPGEAIAVLPTAAGGHLSHHAIGAAGIRGLRVLELPYDVDAHDVCVVSLPEFLERERPRLVVVGASLMLFPHDLETIAEMVHDAGATLLYDASHVAGLIAGGRFQQPLAEGADIVTFSTYKSFGGPPGGAIVTNDAALAERVSRAVYPGLTANYDASRLAPLTVAATEASRFGSDYAAACISNAATLAEALHADSLPVVGAEAGFTASHHVALDAAALGGSAAASRRLADAGIYCSGIELPVGRPVEAGDGLRFGTQELTRRGFDRAAMREVATLCRRALWAEEPAEAVRADARALRSRHAGMAYCLPA